MWWRSWRAGTTRRTDDDDHCAADSGGVEHRVGLSVFDVDGEGLVGDAEGGGAGGVRVRAGWDAVEGEGVEDFSGEVVDVGGGFNVAGD